MSVSAFIRVHLTNAGSNRGSSIEIIKVLMNCDWSISHHNYVCLLPIEGDEDVDWQGVKDMNFEELKDVIDKKEARKELVGIMLTWRDSLIGCDFLFWPEKKYSTFSIDISSDRQEINLPNNYSITDFQWYLEKILPPLNEAFGVEYFSCEEHR